jgi:hypothetical protein
MKADITLSRKQAETLMAGIGNLFENFSIPKREAKRLAQVAVKLDVAFDLYDCENCMEEAQT